MIKRFALLATFALAACGSNSVILSEARSAESKGEGRTTASPIKHVVFIVQENRSFNNLFMGYPGATTQNYGYDTNGVKIALQGFDLGILWDLGHSASDYFAACDGTGSLPGTDCKMDGWNNELAGPYPPKNAPYSYVLQKDIKPYWDIAKQYSLADNMFASNLDGSFVAHQYIVAAYASRAVDYPLTTWGCEGGKTDTVTTLTKKRTIGKPIVACFNNPTIASEADAAGISWRFYADVIHGFGGFWSSYQADRQIYKGPDWNTDVITPPSQFLTDLGNGNLATITWIAPLWANSDHPGDTANGGPAWVASLVNAIGTSSFWNSTAIFIIWDDWGGFFDPVQPPHADYDGLGFRVPLMIVSPYTKRDRVTHVQYETASVLRYMEDNFGLAQLAPADTRAADPASDPNAFDYSMKPRAFKTIGGGKPLSYWRRIEGSQQMRDGKHGLDDGD